jgi:UDP-4-amino-4,6-dideoxy-N-acetyl-beta-L-altrosamine N-acetyltransferase
MLEDILKGNIYFKGLLAKNFILLDEAEKGFVLQMRNHPEVRRWMKNKEPISFQDHLAFIERLQTSVKDFYWIVQKEKTKEIIGVIYINDLDTGDKKCEFGIYTNPFFSEKGRGILLANLELYIIFEISGIKEVNLEVSPENEAALSLYEKIGFQRSNTLNPLYIKMFLTKSGYRGHT